MEMDGIDESTMSKLFESELKKEWKDERDRRCIRLEITTAISKLIHQEKFKGKEK